MNDNLYQLDQAIEQVKSQAKANFVESVDIVCKLGVDPRKADQIVKGTTVTAPKSIKPRNLIVICEMDDVNKYASMENCTVGSEDLIGNLPKMKLNRRKHVVLTVPSMMPKVGRLGKVLGTKGLMPNAKNNNVTTDLAKEIDLARDRRIYYRTDKNGVIRSAVGLVSQDSKVLSQNIMAFIKDVMTLKPISTKGKYIQSLGISSTMGKYFQIDVKDILK